MTAELNVKCYHDYYSMDFVLGFIKQLNWTIWFGGLEFPWISYKYLKINQITLLKTAELNLDIINGLFANLELRSCCCRIFSTTVSGSWIAALQRKLGTQLRQN